jgi:hypothetical protein
MTWRRELGRSLPTMGSTESARMYAAVLLYVSSSSSAGYDPLYEETVTLIRADSDKRAAERAREFAKAREGSFENEYGETITWSLKRLVDISEIADKIDDGAEIYTRHFRDYEAYRAFRETPLSEWD